MLPAGALMAGYGGASTRVPTVDRLGSPSISSVNLRGWEGPAEWPYTSSDFDRIDETDDAVTYAAPSFVTHLDEAARAALTATYSAFFSSRRTLPGGLSLLDMASSWLSHFPPDLPSGTRVAVHGLNEAELQANEAATEHCVADLNREPRLPYPDSTFDFVTNAASVGYLVHPRAVFAEMHRVLTPGGVAIVSFSNRVFADKASRLWLSHMDEEVGLCSVVRNYFYFGPQGGWSNVSSADISPHPYEGDPLWIVTAVKR